MVYASMTFLQSEDCLEPCAVTSGGDPDTITSLRSKTASTLGGVYVFFLICTRFNTPIMARSLSIMTIKKAFDASSTPFIHLAPMQTQCQQISTSRLNQNESKPSYYILNFSPNIDLTYEDSTAQRSRSMLTWTVQLNNASIRSAAHSNSNL